MNDKTIKKGFLCSFDINEARSARQEILTILSTLKTAEDAKNPTELDLATPTEQSEAEEVSTNGEPRELNKLDYKDRQIKNRKHYKKSFTFEKIGNAKNLCFIFNNTERQSSEIYQSLKDSKIRFKFVKKIVPLDVIVSSDAAYHIQKYLEHKDIEKSFRINYRTRYSDKDPRENIFKTILERYKDIKIDLDNPKYSVCVEVVKKYVGFSLIKN